MYSHSRTPTSGDRFSSPESNCQPSAGTRASPGSRRGVALFTALFFVVGIGALALSAIYLTANATLLSKSYDKEDNLKYASEAALAIGKAELNYNPAALPSSSYVTLMSNQAVATADNQTVPGITVNVYLGPTGSTSGQFGRYASIVAQAVDASGSGVVRRLELSQESFAKFAYWTNSETNNGSTIYFNNGDQLWGPVWSNDTIHIGSGGATFHDSVGTAGTVSGAGYGTFSRGYLTNQKKISLPSLSSLSKLSSLASAGGFNFTAPTSGDETTVRMRIDFVAADMNTPPDNDSTGTNEGFFRVYTANSGQTAWLRADWPSNALSNPQLMTNCGDWHYAKGDSTQKKFFPFYAHYHATSANTWFDTVTSADHGGSVAAARAEADSVKTSASMFGKLMQNHTVRCYPGGDPHLVAVSRDSSAWTTAQKHKGGEDTTFTATDRFGHWTQYTTTPNSTIAAKRPNDADYLFPLYRGFNTNTKGVIYVAGTVGISGVLRGDITLYSPNTIVILGDMRYANDPANGTCLDMLGLISGANSVVADNAINTPQNVKSSGSLYKSFDITPDFYLHGVVMALGTSFEVQNYSTGPTNALTCQTSTDGRGCLYLTGGVIQSNRGAVGTSLGTGYVKRYSYDQCVIANPPPYFPTTGRFQDNRYYELDPVRFNVGQLFQSLTPH